MNCRRMFLVAGMALVAGCGHRLASLEDYDEAVRALAISPSGDSLVVLGDKFHYVFQPPGSLVAALRSDLRKYLSADFQEFELDSATEIRGRWSLVVPKDINRESAQLASALGFRQDDSGKYVLKGSISGTRYRKSDEVSASIEKTNNVYRIHVAHSKLFQSRSELERSPVSRANGGVILGLVVFSPLVILLNPCITCR